MNKWFKPTKHQIRKNNLKPGDKLKCVIHYKYRPLDEQYYVDGEVADDNKVKTVFTEDCNYKVIEVMPV